MYTIIYMSRLNRLNRIRNLKGGMTIMDENAELRREIERLTYEVEKLTNLSKENEYGRLDQVNRELGIKTDTELLETITGDDLPTNLIDILNLLTIVDIDKQSKNTSLVGSFKSKAIKYPGDIDMLEFYTTYAKDDKEAINKISEAVKNVARDIQNRRDVVLADFKCGFDKRFDNLVKNLGILERDYANPDMIEYFECVISGYNREVCVLELENLYNSGVLDIDSIRKIYQMLPKSSKNEKMTGKKYLDIFKVLRKFRLLRWNVSEIIEGVKVVKSRNERTNKNYVITLEEALTHDTLTKLDLWAKIGLRWTELTNIFIFKYKNTATNEILPIGFDFKVDINEATKIDIMYYSSPEHEKPFKLAKRIWNRAFGIVSRAYNIETKQIDSEKFDKTQYHIMKLLYPLFSADINKLSQSIADIELLISALEKTEQLNLSYSFIFKDLLENLERMPVELFRIMIIPNQVVIEDIKNMINELINQINIKLSIKDYRNITDEQWKQLLDTNYKDELIEKLEKIMKELKLLQESYAKVYLINNKLHPKYPNSIINYEYSFNYLKL